MGSPGIYRFSMSLFSRFMNGFSPNHTEKSASLNLAPPTLPSTSPFSRSYTTASAYCTVYLSLISASRYKPRYAKIAKVRHIHTPVCELYIYNYIYNYIYIYIYKKVYPMLGVQAASG